MSEDPKGLMRRFFGAVNAGDIDALDDLIADDVIEHEEMPGLEPNKEGIKQFFAMFRSAFPDLHIDVHEMLVDGDLVCARAVVTGTHQGELMGMPPTGRRMEMQMIDIVRVRGGQAAEHWGVADNMAMMQQLGAVPEQAPA
jgi:steroid delta-isomerase-like uncharacterized protein